MIILGLDPSTKAIGYAVLDTDGDAVLDCGVYKPGGRSFDWTLLHADVWLNDYCAEGFYGLQSEHDIWKSATAIEMPVKHRNVKTTITLAQLVGVLRTAAFNWMDTIIEVIPAERLTWLGLPGNLPRKMAKEQVTRLINWRYSLDLKPEDHDAADAVAVALAGWCKLRTETMT